MAASSFAEVLAPVTVGALADTASLTIALMVVPLFVAVAAAGLVIVQRSRSRTATRAVTDEAGVNEE